MTTVGRPTTLLAELSYRCPLHCPYCSNPLDLGRADAELSTEDWKRVLSEARALGVLQLGLSGGEPLLRRDLEALIGHARSEGLYSTLVTSGVGLTADRMTALKDAGLDHIQISIQDAEQHGAERIAGARVWTVKLDAARFAKESGLAFTINVVLHRANIERATEIIDLAASLGADRLELANTQFHGWALANRAALMPSASQLAAAEQAVIAARERYRGQMRILYVLSGYRETEPAACMGGWGSVYIVIAPDGRALPCQGALQIATMSFDSVREHSLEWIWTASPAFTAFRGEEWMLEPCRSCARRSVDFGGCRCQTFALTGDARNADPTCGLSAHRQIIDAALEESDDRFAYRGIGHRHSAR